jgi:RNA-directed DNA polymerase
MGLFDFILNLFGLGKQNRARPINRQTSRPTSSTSAPVPRTSSVTLAPAPPLAQRTPAAPPPPKRLDLDASQFAPIAVSDAVAQATQSANLIRSNPWWGRLDTIPPASDLRTLLIDRTLVAYGLFQPEDLVEIHKIGDKMLGLKAEYALAEAEARAVVAANEEERNRIKAEKQAASARKKQEHAEAVARRKATDIIFLGRGVSRGLADRRANVERLQAAGLPILATPAEVAAALNLTIPRLRWLAFHSDAAQLTHYIRFQVPKKSGGVRELAAPHRDLAAAQRWIFDNVLRKLPTHAAAHGFNAGRSILTNAEPHVGQQILVNADLQDFFPTITFHRVCGAFIQLGYSPAVATIFALLTTESPRRLVDYAGERFHVATGPRALPQGACTSPALSNLIARRLDSRLAGIAAKLGWTYTRYADDLSFSASTATDKLPQAGYLLARIRHIAQDEGFAVNEKKTRVLKRSAAMAVTGVIVNERPAVSRRERRRLRAVLHNANRHGLASQNRANHPHFESQLRGQIEFVRMVNRDHAQPLLEAFATIRQ